MIEMLNKPIRHRYVCVVPDNIYVYAHMTAVIYLTEAWLVSVAAEVKFVWQ
jgi:hypothetical protein